MLETTKRWLADRVRAYWELPQYISDVKKAGTEIAYGESLVALIFGIYTFVNNVSLNSVLTFFAASFILAGYHIWRSYYLRSVPKLEFQQTIFQQLTKAKTTNTLTPYLVNYVQLLPQCSTDSPVDNCHGRLLRVLIMGKHGWQRTALDEPLDLVWSNHDTAPRTLEPGDGQRLNLLSTSGNQVYLECPDPTKGEEVLKVERTFLFQVRVSGKDCPVADINVRVRFLPRGPAEVVDGLPTPVEVAIVTQLQ